MKRQISAARGPYGNEINVNTNALVLLQRTLQDAYDIIEELDDETFQAAQLETLVEELDISIREIRDTIKFARSLR